MKKTAMALVIMMGVALNSFAANPDNPVKAMKGKKKMTTVKKVQRPKEWLCFDVSYNLSCGSIWQGSVCVYTDLTFLTNQQFQTGWNVQNIAVCGIHAEWW
ncbi:MAG: hypothetical protein NTW29_13725 [Bacteroidetes bacterium]|nr:hypothetical protein [Bacteroidota bacterium]